MFLLVLPTSTFASGTEPRLYADPSSGYVKVNTEFSYDIKIDSAGHEITLSRLVLTFDPQKVKVTKAERNSSLFCQWPVDNQSIDNTNGVIMVSGFCQSGTTTKPYKTVGEPDVIVRITFRALATGELRFAWEHNGNDEPFKTVLMETGSPPLNILTTKPSDFSFTSVAASTTPTPGTDTPNTGVIDNTSTIAGIGIVGGSILVFGGLTLLAAYQRVQYNRKYKTVVVYK